MAKTPFRESIFSLILALTLLVLFFSPPPPSAPVLPEPVTPADLQTRYNEKRLNILIVPGHDNEYHGAEFGVLYEADLTLLAANSLYTFFTADPHFEVRVARDLATGEYTSELTEYFKTEQESIRAFRAAKRNNFVTLVNSGEVANYTGVPHRFAKDEVALRLYGINKWANEHEIDIVIHIHFNDYAGRPLTQVGQYVGLAIYVPEKELPNARSSQDVADEIYKELRPFFATSNSPVEDIGVIEDRELIAIGADASRDGASLLIEYGYIYEPQFAYPETRRVVLAEMNWQIYRALKKYFEPSALMADTLLLPYNFNRELGEGVAGRRDVLALQRALDEEKVGNCFLNGVFDGCVKQAVMRFQKKYGLAGAGYVGQATLKKLNSFYFNP
ncbi:MAG: peptidoglycan-binding protein [Candidatus Vogelbacteria bacterium]|nr:peptidoglycan-binding protein [Candidatus Vogelbacteria bacterium]